MAEKQGRPIPKLFGAEFYAHCPCVVSWHTSEGESMLQVTASKPPMDTIRDGVGRLGELNDSLKTLKIGSDASVRHKLPADLLDALLEAVAALNASLGPPAQRGRRGPPHAPSSSPIDSPLEKGEYMLFDTDI